MMKIGIGDEKSHKDGTANERGGMLYCLQRRNRLLFDQQP
jgi:hypothetical protein